VSAEIESPAGDAGPARRGFLRAATSEILIVLGVVLTIISLLANYVQNELLDQANFKDLSSQLIAQQSIRDQLSATIVEQTFGGLDVEAQLASTLPTSLQGLAGPIASASREVTQRAVDNALDRPKVQTLFVNAASVTQTVFVRLLDGDTRLVDSSNGTLVLDLSPLVAKIGDRFAVVNRLGNTALAGKAQITLLESDKLKTAQDATSFLRAIANWIWLPTLLLWAAAIWLARGSRRRVLREVMLGLIVVGIGVLAIRAEVERYVVDNVVAADSVRPAARDAMTILTAQLKTAAWLTFFVGLVGFIGIWLAGPARRAAALRRLASPYAASQPIAWGVFFVLAVLLLWWDPFATARNLVIVLVLGGVGWELLRRITEREPAVESTGRRRFLFARGDDVAGEIERYAHMHAAGSLTDDEFRAVKARLLAPAAPGA
jgi:hypothetical protein